MWRRRLAKVMTCIEEWKQLEENMIIPVMQGVTRAILEGMVLTPEPRRGEANLIFIQDILAKLFWPQRSKANIAEITNQILPNTKTQPKILFQILFKILGPLGVA